MDIFTTHTKDSFAANLVNPPTCLLDSGRKLVYPEEAHANTGRIGH